MKSNQIVPPGGEVAKSAETPTGYVRQTNRERKRAERQRHRVFIHTNCGKKHDEWLRDACRNWPLARLSAHARKALKRMNYFREGFEEWRRETEGRLEIKDYPDLILFNISFKALAVLSDELIRRKIPVPDPITQALHAPLHT